jgi:DNA-binding Xre family transcriptional regulator
LSVNNSRKAIQVMTKLGEYLARKSVNKSEVSRRTGISKARMSELTLNESAKLRAEELYLIALAINVDPCDVLKEVCGHVKLKE